MSSIDAHTWPLLVYLLWFQPHLMQRASRSPACSIAADPFFPGQGPFPEAAATTTRRSNSATSTRLAYDAVTAFDFSFSGGDSGSLKPASAPASSVQVDDFNPAIVSGSLGDLCLRLDLQHDPVKSLLRLQSIWRAPTQVAQDGIPASGSPLPNLPLLTDKQFLGQFNDSFTEGTVTSISAVPLPARFRC